MNALLEAPKVAIAELDIPVVAVRTGEVLPDFKSLPIWHDHGSFWIRTKKDAYIEESAADVRRDLRGLGYDSRVPVGGTLSPIDSALQHFQHENSVAYVGPLAGKRKGICIEQGRVVLVTEEYKLPMPQVGGDFPTIRALVGGMLDYAGVEQSVYFYGWLKRSYESLASGKLNPGQVVALVGPRSCGKSLLQTLICTILGGRSANPFAWMAGGQFNSDLFCAENLCFGDEVSASSDIRTRRKFAAAIKQLSVNETQTCHAKQRVPVSLRPFWRVTFSSNDEAENLLILPPLDDSVEDKLMIFKAQRPEIFDTPAWSMSRTKNMAKLEAEIPYFLNFLQDFSIPLHLEDNRFGIVAYQHPDIRVALETMSPEERLLELMDEIFWPDDCTVGTGDTVYMKAATIERKLVGKDSEVRESARSLLGHWSGATGTYLARLADREDGRVHVKTLHGHKVYRLSHPRTPGAPSNRATINPERRGKEASGEAQ